MDVRALGLQMLASYAQPQTYGVNALPQTEVPPQVYEAPSLGLPMSVTSAQPQAEFSVNNGLPKIVTNANTLPQAETKARLFKAVGDVVYCCFYTVGVIEILRW
jgi:hypothetical protein